MRIDDYIQIDGLEHVEMEHIMTTGVLMHVTVTGPGMAGWETWSEHAGWFGELSN